MSKARDLEMQSKGKEQKIQMEKQKNKNEKSNDSEKEETKASAPMITAIQTKRTDSKLSFSNKQDSQLDSKTRIDEKGFKEETSNAIRATNEKGKMKEVSLRSASVQKQRNQDNVSRTSQSQSRLEEVQRQKKLILDQLQKLDEQIASIKGQKKEKSVMRKREEIQQNQQARQDARKLIKHFRNQRKALEEKRKKAFERSCLIVKYEEQKSRKQRQQRARIIKEQKQRSIQKRMNDEKQRKKDRQQIQKESNRLISLLKKENQFLKQKQANFSQFNDTEVNKIQTQKKRNQIKQIQDHQKRYILAKEKNNQKKKQRLITVNYPIQHYQKNIWAEKLKEEELKRQSQEKMKEQTRKVLYSKRIKYGQLIKNMFSPHKISKNRVLSQPTSTDNDRKNKQENSRQINKFVLPKIAASDHLISQNIALKQQVDELRFNYYKKKQSVKYLKEKTEEQEQKEKKQRMREVQIRKQTKLRLLKIQNQNLNNSLDIRMQIKSKPKYQNYLGKIKVQKRDDTDFMKIIMEDSRYTKEQKYSKMLEMANQMQNKAKMKQEILKDGDQKAIKLYIGSIQAKLALLQQF